MTKRGFITLIMAVLGGLVFALGMCMCLIPEWDSFNQGVITTALGGIILIALLIYRLRTRDKKIDLPGRKTLGIIVLGTAGVLVLGLGMCMTMVWQSMMPAGIVVGIAGIVMLLCLIPAIKGFKG